MLPTVALALVLVIAVLAVPVEVAFTVRRRETLRGAVSVGWLFGAVRARLPLRSPKPPSGRPGKRKRGGRVRGRRAVALVSDAAFRRRLFKAVKDVLGTIGVSGLTLRARLGFADPADTGMLWGFVGALGVHLAGTRRASVRIDPEFTGEAFEFDGAGAVRVVPLHVVLTVFAFLLSPVTLRAIWVTR